MRRGGPSLQIGQGGQWGAVVNHLVDGMLNELRVGRGVGACVISSFTSAFASMDSKNALAGKQLDIIRKPALSQRDLLSDGIRGFLL